MRIPSQKARGPGYVARPLCILLALALLALGPRAQAAPRGGLLVVVLDQVNWAQIRAADAPHLHWLMRTGAVGLMNTRKPREPKFVQAYLNLGAGAGTTVTGDGFRVGWGVDADNQGQFQVPPATWRRLIRNNAHGGGQGRLGLLGDTLREHGRHILVLAYAEEGRRFAPGTGSAPFLDGGGRVPGGHVWAEDADFWAQASREYLLKEDLVVLLCTGEAVPYRPHPLSLDTSRPVLERIAEADYLLGRFLRGALDLRRDRVLVVSAATPDYRREDEHSPAWAVAAGAGIRPGLLTSASTRRVGLVSNTDFAPSVLTWLEIPVPAQMTGHPWQVAPGGPADLDRFNRQAVITWRIRYPLARTFALCEGVVVWILLGALLFAPRFVTRRGRVLRAMALFGVAQPLVLLAMGPWPLPVAWQAVGVLWLGSGLLAGLALLLPMPAAVGTLAATTAAAVVADTLAGSPCMRTAVTSYDPIMGSRFYGMGNEFMAVMVMSAVLASGFLRGGRGLPARAVGGLAVVAVVVTGLSRAGANFGGALTAAVGLGTAALVLAEGAPRRRHLAWLAGILVAAAALVLGLEALQGPLQSHIGQMAGVVQRDGWEPALAALRRKAEMNWRLLFFSRWTLYPLTVTALVAWESCRPHFMAGAFAKWPGVRAAAASAAAAVVATMLFNDSGFAAGSMAVTMMATALPGAVVAAREKGA